MNDKVYIVGDIVIWCLRVSRELAKGCQSRVESFQKDPVHVTSVRIPL